MNQRELHSLFGDKDQTLLVATETARLAELTEDELDALLTRVRRARNKYTKLYRRQSGALVDSSSSRAGTSTSNQRTRRKAEIFEDALARVARALSAAARATANELKQERLQAARDAKGRPVVEATGRSGAPGRSATPSRVEPGAPARAGKSSGRYDASRQASTTATNSRRQARRDTR